MKLLGFLFVIGYRTLKIGRDRISDEGEWATATLIHWRNMYFRECDFSSSQVGHGMAIMAPLHDGPALVQQNGHAMDEKDLHNGDVQL
ncbi:hypothetical protein EVAR_8912_1 [Eumeta japonica]|uniref:Uncharacterized protein n=1 Tax=Eumeta variegata TaxID=151549 RepID=A0A4C1U0B4_EUMVA|nr:hypothetical protein EVAR_8912_1 [Eumeta japonica]